MAVTGKLAGWPDWRDESAYGYTRRLRRRGWAWEFLRRNQAFQRDLKHALDKVEYMEKRSALVVMRLPIDLRRWGLLFRKLPWE